MYFFNEVIIVFNEYYLHNDLNKTEGFKNDLACEASERIEKLDYILEKVRNIDLELDNLIKIKQRIFSKWVRYTRENNIDFSKAETTEELNSTKEETEKQNILLNDLEIYTEYFYYKAFSLRTILRSLPGLGKFECKSIRDVRNKLIEHPETDKDSQVLIRSFGYGNLENGPVIKAVRYENQTDIFPDKGLYVNSIELKNNLLKVFKNYCNNKTKK